MASVLEEARRLGFLGPGPVEPHLDHARTFLQAWAGGAPGAALDLGTGGGIPALALALAWPDSHWALVEANGRRSRFLVQAVHRVGLEGRVEVWADRAEALGRDRPRRGSRDLVTARGFGPPAVTAECAAPFLGLGGRLLVSEPPEPRPWPADRLGALGLAPVGRRGSIMVLEQVAPCPSRFPRRNPARAALF